jgi:hypothetical protein
VEKRSESQKEWSHWEMAGLVGGVIGTVAAACYGVPKLVKMTPSERSRLWSKVTTIPASCRWNSRVPNQPMINRSSSASPARRGGIRPITVMNQALSPDHPRPFCGETEGPVGVIPVRNVNCSFAFDRMYELLLLKAPASEKNQIKGQYFCNIALICA